MPAIEIETKAAQREGATGSLGYLCNNVANPSEAMMTAMYLQPPCSIGCSDDNDFILHGMTPADDLEMA